MIVISPGVEVIADYDEPIFYSDNYYWRNQGGFWYRSSTHTSGWVRYSAPSAILAISQPAAYVHYHGEARANGNASGNANGHAGAEPVVRDHREEQRDEHEDKHDNRDHGKH